VTGLTAEQIRMARARERRAQRKERAAHGIITPHDNNNTSTTNSISSSSNNGTSRENGKGDVSAVTDNNESARLPVTQTPADISTSSTATATTTPTTSDHRRRRLISRAQLRRIYIVTPLLSSSSSTSSSLSEDAWNINLQPSIKVNDTSIVL
jgi:hypothetical protein